MSFYRRDLEQRHLLLSRARSNLTSLHRAFGDGIALLMFEMTPGRRYDESFVSPELVQHGRFEKKYFESWNNVIIELLSLVESLIDINEAVFRNGSYSNDTDLEYILERFAYRSRSFNYYKFMYSGRIVYALSDVYQALIEEFDKNLDEMEIVYQDLHRELYQIHNVVDKFNSTALDLMSNAVSLAKQYTTDHNVSKMTLAKLLTGSAIESEAKSFTSFFSDLRDKVQGVFSSYLRFYRSVRDTWDAMLSEARLRQFYFMIRNDTIQITQASENRDYLLKILAQLIDIDKQEIANASLRTLNITYNSDWVDIDKEQKLVYVQSIFEEKIADNNMLHILGMQAGEFVENILTLREKMAQYLESSKIDASFYR